MAVHQLPVNPLRWLLRRFVEEEYDDGQDESKIWEGDLRSGPPGDFVIEMSQRFPESEFVMSFAVIGYDERETYSIRNGEGHRTYYMTGYFESCDPKEDKVFCWDICLRFENAEQEQEIIGQLHAEGILIHGELDHPSRQSAEEIIEWIQENYPGTSVEDARSMPLKLNEDWYMNGMS